MLSNNQRNKVFVGMSGGVDSSVAALRLKKRGYNVTGVFIKVWHPDFMVCNWEQERLDAMRVAALLEIPFLTCDAEKVYRDEVADYFIEEYRKGRTPNPDVMCNSKVKFGAFMEFAKDKGADFIATGHYARRIDTDKAELHRGIDTNKDQSYFLWTLTQKQLDYTLFPIGETSKTDIRKEAAQAGIPVANKDDSQGICFLGHVDIPEFLSHYMELRPGDVIDSSGAVIGSHRGAFVYTLGQRHGFTIHTKSASQKPLYVVGKNVDTNQIIVSTERVTVRSSEKVSLHKVVLRTDFKKNMPIEIQFRYRQEPIKATLEFYQHNKATLVLQDKAETPSSGQSCVLYIGDHCIGGGIIA